MRADASNTALPRVGPDVIIDTETDCDAQIGDREEMEDTYVCEEDIGNGWDTAFWGVYDGHSGDRAAEYAMEELHRAMSRDAPPHAGAPDADADTSVRGAISRAYRHVDKTFIERALAGRDAAENFVRDLYEQECEKKAWLCGATAVTVALRGSVLYVAHAGDSLAVLGRGGTAIELTPAHKPHREDAKCCVATPTPRCTYLTQPIITTAHSHS